MGIRGGGLVGLAKDAGGNFSHHTGHQVAVGREARKVQITGLVQVHLAAVDHGHQVAAFDAEGGGQGHEGVHDRVAGLACVGLHHFFLPPGEFGGGHAGVFDFVDHVVHFAAKRIKGGDGGTPLGGQKQEGVIEAAARGGGFLLDIILRAHGQGFSHSKRRIKAAADRTIGEILFAERQQTRGPRRCAKAGRALRGAAF